MIQFEPDEDQALIVETVRQFAANEIRPRARDTDEAGQLPAEVLAQAHELGLVQNALPEALGGAGERSAVTGALIAEELAWGDLAIALGILSPALEAYALLDGGSEAQQQAGLPRLAGPEFAPAALALVEPRFDSDALRPRTSARCDGDAWVLDGAKTQVPWLPGLTRVGVSADLDGRPELFWVPVESTGLKVEPARFMGVRGLPFADLRLEGVRLPADARNGEDAGSDLRALVDRGRVAQAALAVGMSRAAFEISRDYAKEREAFGVPIATKQAIAFMLADMAIEVDGARLLVWEAAWRLDEGLDAGREAALAIDQARRVAMQVSDGAVQVFGGHGYIREYLPELFLRNAAGFHSFEGLALV